MVNSFIIRQIWCCKREVAEISVMHNVGTLSLVRKRVTDWRLPTKEELSSLIYCSSGKPSYWKPNDNMCEGNYESPTLAQAAFPQTPDYAGYWTSTASDNSQFGGKWLIQFYDGHGRWNGPVLNLYVRMVRGKQK